MHLSALISTLTALLTVASAYDPNLTKSTTPALNITALDGVDGKSVLQCWQLDPFQISKTPGIAGALALNLGNTSNATYSVIGARTNGGLHNAPAPHNPHSNVELSKNRLVYFASGLIHITLPNGTDEAWIVGGKYGLIFAQDTAAKSKYGHGTAYVSDADTVALAVPLAEGQKLSHRVLHSGACTWAEMAGL